MQNNPLPIPSKPYEKYKNDGWISIGDFLGTFKESNIGRTYKTFDDAKLFLGELNLKSRKYWVDYCKKNGKPKDMPINLEKIYRKDIKWRGIGDFLGNGFVATNKREYLIYEEARSIVWKLNLKNQKEWNIYKITNKPVNIPSNPNAVYQDKGWKNWGDFLGTKNKSNRNREYLTYEQAKNIIRKLNLKNQTEWVIYRKTKKPENIPSNPEAIYKNKGWISLGDWLGTNGVAPQKMFFVDFEDAKKLVHQLKLKSNKEWRLLIKNKQKPLNIPSNPDSIYKNKGWQGWADFLGKEK